MKFKLNNGLEIPSIGLGTWQITEREELFCTLNSAYEAGCRLIDTAAIYNNEEVIGDFLKVKNDKQIFVISKVWNTDHGNVEKALDESLKKLKIDCLDLYLVHWPVNFSGPFEIEKVWKQMETLVEKQKVKSIGVANFGIKNLTKLIDLATIKPAVNQIEVHPYLPQHELRDFCNKNNILIQAYSPFGSSKPCDLKVTEDKVINQIAQERNSSPHQVILSYLESSGMVALPRSKTKKHISDNFKTFKLDQTEIDKIESINIRKRYIDPESFGENRFD